MAYFKVLHWNFAERLNTPTKILSEDVRVLATVCHNSNNMYFIRLWLAFFFYNFLFYRQSVILLSIVWINLLPRNKIPSTVDYLPMLHQNPQKRIDMCLHVGYLSRQNKNYTETRLKCLMDYRVDRNFRDKFNKALSSYRRPNWHEMT